MKETALENTTNLFLQKEKELGNKIEELESRLEDLNQDSTVINEHKFQKVSCPIVLHIRIKNAIQNKISFIYKQEELGLLEL